MNIGTLTVTLGVNADALNVAATRMSEFAKKTNTVNQRIRTIGYLTSAVITAPMVAAGRASFNMAKEYEYSMHGVLRLKRWLGSLGSPLKKLQMLFIL